jgi:hypothetical protein
MEWISPVPWRNRLKIFNLWYNPKANSIPNNSPQSNAKKGIWNVWWCLTMNIKERNTVKDISYVGIAGLNPARSINFRHLSHTLQQIKDFRQADSPSKRSFWVSEVINSVSMSRNMQNGLMCEIAIDDGGSTHMWNVGKLQWDYAVQYPRKLSS